MLPQRDERDTARRRDARRQPRCRRRARATSPRTNRWTRGGTLSQPRHLAGSVRLADGCVLIAGGVAGPGIGGLASTEIYLIPQRTAGRLLHPCACGGWTRTLTLLRSGRVLAVSDYPLAARRSAELYDPLTNSWAPAADTPEGSSTGYAALMPDGRVLVVGGDPNSGVSTSTLYDPALPIHGRRPQRYRVWAYLARGPNFPTVVCSSSAPLATRSQPSMDRRDGRRLVAPARRRRPAAGLRQDDQPALGPGPTRNAPASRRRVLRPAGRPMDARSGALLRVSDSLWPQPTGARADTRRRSAR